MYVSTDQINKHDRTDEPAAVGSERHRPSGYCYLTLGPYIAGAPSATLATGTPACWLKGGYACAPVAVINIDM